MVERDRPLSHVMVQDHVPISHKIEIFVYETVDRDVGTRNGQDRVPISKRLSQIDKDRPLSLSIPDR